MNSRSLYLLFDPFVVDRSFGRSSHPLIAVSGTLSRTGSRTHALANSLLTLPLTLTLTHSHSFFTSFSLDPVLVSGFGFVSPVSPNEAHPGIRSVSGRGTGWQRHSPRRVWRLTAIPVRMCHLSFCVRVLGFEREGGILVGTRVGEEKGGVGRRREGVGEERSGEERRRRVGEEKSFKGRESDRYHP
jgi:hypothetical protein